MLLLVYINIWPPLCCVMVRSFFVRLHVLLCSSNVFLVFFLRVDMGPVVRDTTDQMRIAFSHQLRVLTAAVYCDGHQQHVTKSNPFVAFYMLARCRPAAGNIIAQQQLKRKLQKKLHQLLFFIFVYIERIRKWAARHICSVNLFIHKKSNEKWNDELLICCCCSSLY